jgi:hypothetical protein
VGAAIGFGIDQQAGDKMRGDNADKQQIRAGWRYTPHLRRGFVGMHGYLIDAVAQEIRPIAYEYGDLRQYLPGGLAIGLVFGNGDVLYVDDEGLMRPADRAFRINQRPDGQPMMSNGILTGRDQIDTTLAPEMTIAELAREIEFISVPAALTWFRARVDEPAVYATDAGGSQTTYAHWLYFLNLLLSKP